jgi:hypothetical protein
VRPRIFPPSWTPPIETILASGTYCCTVTGNPRLPSAQASSSSSAATVAMPWRRPVPSADSERAGLRSTGNPIVRAASDAAAALEQTALGGGPSPKLSASSWSRTLSTARSRTSCGGRPVGTSGKRSRCSEIGRSDTSADATITSGRAASTASASRSTYSPTPFRGSGSVTRRDAERDQCATAGVRPAAAITSYPTAARPRQTASAARSSASVTSARGCVVTRRSRRAAPCGRRSCASRRGPRPRCRRRTASPARRTPSPARP